MDSPDELRPAAVRVIHVLLAALGLMLAQPAGAQGTTRGTDFWACDMENSDITQPFAIVVANSGTADSLVRVEGSSGTLATVTVAAGTLSTLTFDRSRQMVGTFRARRAYHVVATEPVAVFQFNPLVGVSTNDASIVLPVAALGTEYRVMSWPQTLFRFPGSVAVIGTSVERTTVTFTPRGNVQAGFVPATGAGTPIVFTLDRFEVAQFATTTDGSDFTGSLITSDRPVAVFGGATCASVPIAASTCEHVEEAMVPVESWGRDYLAVKSPPRIAEPDYWRILASEDATSVTLTPDVVGTPITLQAGEFSQFSTTEDVHVLADKPILVAQYLVSQSIIGPTNEGDPSLILVVPTEQFDDDHIFLSPATFPENDVVLVKPAGAAVDLDAATVPDSSFTPIGVTGHARATIALSAGTHRVSSTAGVGVYAIGYDDYTSYGYHAGAKADDINSSISCDPGGPQASGCPGRPLLLDGSGSSGPGTLTYLWSALSPGLTLETPDAPTTSAMPTNSGPWSVSLTVTNGTDTSTCVTTIAGSNDMVAPIVDCPTRVDAIAASPAGAFVEVLATVADDCDPSPSLGNSRTAIGDDASDTYPCGETSVTFAGRDSSGNVAICETLVSVAPAGPPSELSASAAVSWLRVAKTSGDPTQLDVIMEIPADSAERVNLYLGTILPTRFVAYDHAPLTCHVAPLDQGGGVGLLRVPLDVGVSHYFLVSSSHCLAEGTRGARSDGLVRPTLATDCGPLP